VQTAKFVQMATGELFNAASYKVAQMCGNTIAMEALHRGDLIFNVTIYIS
jgi:hypothetical protein